MDWYLSLVKAHPITSAMAQFAVLGTLGEVLSKWLLAGRIHSPFTGFVAFTDGLVAHGLLPALGAFGKAFAVSLAMNLQFGPFLVLAHRLIDNAIDGRPNWAGLDKGFKSLLWFWVPAHTLTFMLPVDLRIGLAAVWSLALGLILGWYNKPAKV